MNRFIELIIQAVMKNVIGFDQCFKQKLFDSDSIHDSNQNRLQVCTYCSTYFLYETEEKLFLPLTHMAMVIW